MHLFANMVGSRALALMEKQVNNTGPCYIRLVGRKSGLLDWILTLLKVNTTTVLEVYSDRIEYSYGSLSGNILEVIPLSKVSNLICGRFRPTILLFFAFLSFLAAIPTLGLSLILTAVFVIFYFLKKTTLIQIIPNSSSMASVAFKRSIIENQNITEEEAKYIVQLVAFLVENANKK